MDPFEIMRHNLGRMFGYWPETELLPSDTAFTAEYPMDLREENGKIVVDMEAPGFKKDEIDVSVENGVLTVSAERKEEEPRGTSHLRERRYTRVERSVALPAAVDEEKVDATLRDGVLHLEMPQTEQQRRRRIAVR
jgi:HSP20 family protein